MTDNPLWDVIQEYMDDPKHRYAPRVADLARETGISEQLLSKWKTRVTMPEAGFLLMFAQGTGVPYERLLTAALQGRSYLPPGTKLVLPGGYDEWLTTSDVVTRARQKGADSMTLAARRSSKHPPSRRQE